MWPPPPPPEPSPQAVAAATAAPELAKEPEPPNYFNITLKDSLMYTGGLGGLIGKFLLQEKSLRQFLSEGLKIGL